MTEERAPRRIAPRVILYTQGGPQPDCGPGELALAGLAPVAGAPAAFGDGRHPTTRLCAAAVDLLCRRKPGLSVLDVGTGTGVLARIARARQAGRVVATDIDPEALVCARAHAALDADPLPIGWRTDRPDALGERFDLVVANILEAPLRELAPALGAALLPGGHLLLSGFTRVQVPALRRVYGQAGLLTRSEAQLDGWMLLDFGHAQDVPGAVLE